VPVGEKKPLNVPTPYLSEGRIYYIVVGVGWELGRVTEQQS